MTTETFIYIIIAGIISLAVAIFMYGYKSKQSPSLRWVFGALRFFTLFLVLLLLINPKFKTQIYTIEKPKLPIVIDNSASVSELNQAENVSELVARLKNDEKLNEKFDLSYYSFGSQFRQNDTLNFDERNTNIASALASVDELFKNEIAPTVLITDGNQTLGADYEFSRFKNTIHTVILGDSTKYMDLKIEHLNTNRYAFLKNHFPVEVILSYSGETAVSSEFVVSQGTTIVYRSKLSFSENENTQTISFTLPANSVGLQKYKAEIIPLEEERNKTNNTKQFAVEIIDQATDVLLISNIIHPDIGAFKKAVSSSEYRSFTHKTPSEAVSLLNEYELLILYQPDRSFSQVYKEIEKLNKNTFVITGIQTDWNFLNSVQKDYRKQITNQTERVSGILNNTYPTFAIEDIDFNSYPPLETKFGELSVSTAHEVLLTQAITGIVTNSPLLATMEIDGKRTAIWDAEGVWRWRAESFLENNDFKQFDDFVGKLIQYLASNKRRSRLEVQSESFYYNHNPILIAAQYFDRNYEFDSRVSLHIQVKNQETDKLSSFPLLLKNNYFEVDLSSLEAGEYSYTVSTAEEAISRSGNFTILEFNVEQQFLNADVRKLQRLAQGTAGESYFISEGENLIKALLDDKSFQNIERSQEKVVPLIDWKYLLALLVLSLSAEWFLRKYNGLI